jgi:trans-aconitate methyltransferase
MRLGESAINVDWIVADLLSWRPSRKYDVWHDRAVLHFLTEESERSGYLDALRSALEVGGHVVIGVFAEDGPEQCSGLMVRRYSRGDLEDLLGPEFQSVDSTRELHGTPGGNQQSFTWLTARRVK